MQHCGVRNKEDEMTYTNTKGFENYVVDRVSREAARKITGAQARAHQIAVNHETKKREQAQILLDRLFTAIDRDNQSK
jgi:hypothetical protein